MAFEDPKRSAAQKTNVDHNTEEFFVLEFPVNLTAFKSGEKVHVQLAAAFGSSAGVVFRAYATLDPTGGPEAWDTRAFDTLVLLAVDGDDPARGSMTFTGRYRIRIGVLSLDNLNTVDSADCSVRSDQVELAP